jgi:hypothetical protein
MEKTKKDKAKQAEELRRLIDEKGLRESLGAFRDMVIDKDPDAIRALLLLNSYSDDDDFIDEMYTVVHSVEGFPRHVYVRELLASIPEFAIKSPYLLDMLMIRLLCSTYDDVHLFVDCLARSSAEIKYEIKHSLERIKKDITPEDVNLSRNWQTVLNSIAGGK